MTLIDSCGAAAHRSASVARSLARLVATLLAAVMPAPALADAQALIATGDEALGHLERRDFAGLGRQICPGRRLGYSPYARNLTRLPVRWFDRGQVAGFATSTKAYFWGHYDGSGKKIVLTPSAYHDSFVLDRAYRTQGQRRLLEAESLRREPELKALWAAYPGVSLVSYRYPGTPQLGNKDARELILILEARASGACLRGVAHSEDTV
ncbi:exported hypothetical protein [Rubrivivax sp. A210]|uniref:hypothetical protein n=1 Tax=Rubrivivax sp. A210 TaxID=2772301 RepID=UPI00191A3335|nr:hypothetical protein [Rubrivivax sp. A210]CAD5374118.1 exported hypothetical protein [Rubrivivax sp. A210]